MRNVGERKYSGTAGTGFYHGDRIMRVQTPSPNRLSSPRFDPDLWHHCGRDLFLPVGLAAHATTG